MNKTQKTGIAFGVLFFITIVGIVVNSGIQNSWYTVDVLPVAITSEDGYLLAGKLYLPKGVDQSQSSTRRY